jgi:hypothetical protein
MTKQQEILIIMVNERANMLNKKKHMCYLRLGEKKTIADV